MKIENSWYGYEVFERLIPLLDPRTKNSILHGDYIGENEHQNILHEAFRDEVCPVQPITFQHSTQFYVVYINNLTDMAFQKLADSMMGFEGYVGRANTTYHSHFKTLLSMRLVNLSVKCGRKIVQGHEDDRDEADNVNMCGYLFEEHGYECISIRSGLDGVFLSYKIESPAFNGLEADTEMSINAVNAEVSTLDDFDVQVEGAKLGYIKSVKGDCCISWLAPHLYRNMLILCSQTKQLMHELYLATNTWLSRLDVAVLDCPDRFHPLQCGFRRR